jgi:hypothetical protein
MGDGNGLKDNRINKIDLEDDSNCLNKPRDYLIPKSIIEQADSKVSSELSIVVTLQEPSIEPETFSESIPLESSLSRVKTPSSSSLEPP